MRFTREYGDLVVDKGGLGNRLELDYQATISVIILTFEPTRQRHCGFLLRIA